MPEEPPPDQKQIAIRSTSGSWIEWVFRNAPAEIQEKAKTRYWMAVDALWSAGCLTSVYVVVGLAEFAAFKFLSWGLAGTLARNLWLSNIWSNIQVGLALISIGAWCLHALFSVITQVGLDYSYNFTRKKK